jgi:hypothetical protein
MAALINTLDNYTPTQIGTNGHVEYGWSNSIQEKIVQFSFQLTRTENLKPLENQLVSMLETLRNVFKLDAIPMPLSMKVPQGCPTNNSF